MVSNQAPWIVHARLSRADRRRPGLTEDEVAWVALLEKDELEVRARAQAFPAGLHGGPRRAARAPPVARVLPYSGLPILGQSGDPGALSLTEAQVDLH